ncbi:peptide chain release factor N(5)-glutamine methyltransferase [Candidatus Ichthyocystis sparus]|nr:peptide chain release factor N(5)-glutamine methyltransferase [Candidatus Ichthyocystis sparus]
MSRGTYCFWISNFRKYISYQESIWIITHLTKCNHVYLLTNMDKLVPYDATLILESAYKKLKKGVPVSYIIGSSYFMGNSFLVSSGVMIPRPETELLLMHMFNKLSGYKDQRRILDLGTGSGIVAIMAKKFFPRHEVWATDISHYALEVAKKNSLLHGVDIRLAYGSWYDAVQGEKFDLIASNPPYISDDDPHIHSLRNEPQIALISEQYGYGDIVEIAIGAPYHLHKGGCLMVEHGWQQGSGCQRIFHENGFTIVSTHKDSQFRDRVTSGMYIA